MRGVESINEGIENIKLKIMLHPCKKVLEVLEYMCACMRACMRVYACVCVRVCACVVVEAFKVQGGSSALGGVGDSVVAPRFCL